MLRNMNKILLIVIVTLLLIFNSSIVLAQPGIEITRAETQIMPEYDAPEILIVNTIEMKNSATQDYNGDVKWRVPKGALKHIVSDKSAGDTHVQFNVVPSQDYDELVWKFPAFKAGETKSLHLEYYYNNLQGNSDKKFTFEFSQPYPVNSAQMIMLQPLKATNVKINPEFGQPIQGQNGFTYYAKNFTNIGAEQKNTITVTYTKTDPSPSVNPQQQQAQAQNQGAGQGGGEAAGNTSSSTVVILFLAGFAIVLVLIIAKAMLNKNRAEDDEYENDEYEDEEELEEDDDELDPWEKSAKKKQTNKNKTRENKHSRKVSKSQQENENNVINSSTLSNGRWFESQKRKLRQQLIEGRINESMYIEMVMELEEEAKTRNTEK